MHEKQVTKFFKTSIKLLSLAALVVFTSVIVNYLTRNNNSGSLNDSIKVNIQNVIPQKEII